MSGGELPGMPSFKIIRTKTKNSKKCRFYRGGIFKIQMRLNGWSITAKIFGWEIDGDAQRTQR
jgi:hypothetical protein